MFRVGQILGSELQMTFKKAGKVRGSSVPAKTLADLRSGEEGILDRIDLPADIARRLMELGFLPGNTVIPAHLAPGGGARVFQVDGSEVALRHDTAARLFLRTLANATPVMP
jgi:ferrous iron transport protein A